jgi:hypothetical protein
MLGLQAAGYERHVGVKRIQALRIWRSAADRLVGSSDVAGPTNVVILAAECAASIARSERLIESRFEAVPYIPAIPSTSLSS